MKKLLVANFILIIFALAVFAQLTTTNLIGTVSSPDGVLPGATVTVKDDKTGKEIVVTSKDDGSFTVSNLEIGSYTVIVSSQGFKTYTAQNVKLQTGQNYDLSVKLEIGGVNETVTITAGADIVNSSDAKISGNVSNKQLTTLPLLTRNPLNFVPLQAGVAQNSTQLSTINGVRTSATNITIEGVNVQDNYIRANATDFSPARPIVDEVEEFAVSGLANVEDGFGSGQIQFPIRRGGNKYNGSLYEYNRNSSLGANSFFNNASGVARGYRNRNEFGGRISGPLPFFNFGEGGPAFIDGKDKLFFFFLYQKTIDVQPLGRAVTVLTNNARQGLFTYTAGANDAANGITAGQTVTVNIFNPTLSAATGITGINPLIQSRILPQIVAGNSTDLGDGRVTTGYRFNQNANTSQQNYSTRIDYKINDTNNFKGIYRYVSQTVQSTAIDIANGGYGKNPTADQPSKNPFLSLGWTSSFSSNFTNELGGGLYYSDPKFLRNSDAPSAFFTMPVVSNVSFITNPETVFLNQGRDTKAYNIQDTATYLAGNHSIHFGGQFQVNRIIAFDNGSGTSSINPVFGLGVGANTPQISTAQFTNTTLFPGTVPQAQRANANALLALLGGIVGSGSQTFNVTSQTSGFVPGASNPRKYYWEQYGAYGSDQWRITPDLTLNFGLRYDVYTAIRNPEGLFFEPAIPDGTLPETALLNPNGFYQFVGGNAGSPGRFFKTDKNNFSPNFGFAYSPKMDGGVGGFLFGNGKTVLRGGYRISYINDEFLKSTINAGVGNAGLTQAAAAINPATNTSALNARANALPTIDTPVFNGNRTYLTNNGPSFSNFGTVYGINPKIQSPKVQEYSFGIQREIGFNSVLEVRYVGTRSNNLLRAIDLNQIEIRANGFAQDFLKARQNLILSGNVSGAYNAAIAGSQPLTVFPNLASGGFLTNATVINNLTNGTPADLALFYIQNAVTGTVKFLPNPNTGVVDYLYNGARFRYNSMQVEFRRRFGQGLLLQANYTFAKNLTDSQGVQTNATGDTQNRFDPLLDNFNPILEYSRALSDQNHKFNLIGAYELPFGKGKRFLNQGGIVNQILGGFELSGVLQIGSGAPITFTDPRGTLNRAGRSNRQTALTSLTKQQLKDLVGVYRTPNGIFFVNPSALGRNPDGTLQTGRTGRGADGFGTAAFTGQVFFNNVPGSTSGLERAVVNGPAFTTLDLSLIKTFKIGERYSFKVEASAFNALNKTNFYLANQSLDINSTSFGRITVANTPRVIQLAGRFSF
ncbi:MAG TPA: TonB-dependent receptor [Pyrinomonadaceae bacterium]|nr:TonB-dependent receptor [Pyrinomonadaceae bacterium]